MVPPPARRRLQPARPGQPTRLQPTAPAAPPRSSRSSSSRLSSISASMRRRISWGAVEVIADSEHSWQTASPADVCIAAAAKLEQSSPQKPLFRRPSDTCRLPTPCRNFGSSDSKQQQGKGNSNKEACKDPAREREQLLDRIAQLEAEMNSLELQRDDAEKREAALEGAVQNMKEHRECGVCLLPYCWPVCLDCGHSVCRTCIADWQQRQKAQGMSVTCPTCVAVVKTSRPAHVLHNVCVALEDPTAACRRTEEDQTYRILPEEKMKDFKSRRMALNANRRRSSMVFVSDGREVMG